MQRELDRWVFNNFRPYKKFDKINNSFDGIDK